MDQVPTEQEAHFPPVSEAQWRVLCCLNLEGGFIDLPDIITLANAIWVTDAIPAAEYENAAMFCLARGWIKVITQNDIQAHKRRWADDPQQTLRQMFCQKGRLDFTLLGWQLYTHIRETKCGETSERQTRECMLYLWDVPGQVSFIGMSEEAVLLMREQIMAGTDELMSGGLRSHRVLGEVTGPYPIGPWWVNRFQQAPLGYRLDVVFVPALKRARKSKHHI